MLTHLTPGLASPGRGYIGRSGLICATSKLGSGGYILVVHPLKSVSNPIWRHDLQSPYHPPQEHGTHQSCSSWCIGLLVFACLIAWPLAIAVGWCIGGRNQVILLESMWTGLFPITNSPGFGLIALTLLPYLVGSVTMFIRPPKETRIHNYHWLGDDCWYAVILARLRNQHDLTL